MKFAFKFNISELTFVYEMGHNNNMTPADKLNGELHLTNKKE